MAIDQQVVADEIEKVDWGLFIKWGTVTIVVRDGEATIVSVEETVKLDTK